MKYDIEIEDSPGRCASEPAGHRRRPEDRRQSRYRSTNVDWIRKRGLQSAVNWVTDACTFPLERVCRKYFGLSVSKAKRRAGLQRLPIPAYRAGSQKSPWLISAADLAKHIDEQRQSASNQWAAMN